MSADERANLIKKLSKLEDINEIAMNADKFISKTPTKSKMLKYENAKDYVLDRHHCAIGIALDEILRGGIPQKFKRYMMGEGEKSSKKSRVSRMMNVCMCGGIGINEISTL